MFIVKKRISGNEYYYLNKSIREGDKIKSKCISYLGKDKEEAKIKAEKIKMKNEKTKTNLENQNLENLKNIEELANFCKEKGFVFRSSEIYGGLSGFWDLGPLGVELFNNIKQSWWNFFIKGRDDIVGIEASIISHPKTWEVSGHIKNFNDVFVKCKECNKTTKLDEGEIGKIKCECGGEYDIQGKFNLMFETNIGVIEPLKAYLRGETAQGMFLDFKSVFQTSRKQLPFGIAQIGRCFRNEIAPRDFMFRSREFHIAEFEFFINPKEDKCNLFDEVHKNIKIRILDEETQKTGKKDLKEMTINEIVNLGKLDEWHGYWLSEQIMWFNSIGLFEIKIREHIKEELSHYSTATFDIDYEYTFGSKEIAGNANRGQYDLMNHQQESKISMELFDEKTKTKIIPRVIEPTFGIERTFMAILTKAYKYDKQRNCVILKIPPILAPIKVAVFPIIKKPEYEEIAKNIIKELRKEWNVTYDKGGSVGRRYTRNDEIGTPYCITIDEESPKNKSITIRDRDTTKQIRVKISELKNILRKLINKEITFQKAGKIIETRIK